MMAHTSGYTFSHMVAALSILPLPHATCPLITLTRHPLPDICHSDAGACSRLQPPLKTARSHLPRTPQEDLLSSARRGLKKKEGDATHMEKRIVYHMCHAVALDAKLRTINQQRDKFNAVVDMGPDNTFTSVSGPIPTT